MRIILFGCGRTGAALASTLIKRKHEVTIIEKDPQALLRLGPDHGCKTIIGDGVDEDILEAAGIGDCDAFIALTRGDNSNLMAAQIVKAKYKIPRICSKVNDPSRAAEYKKMGVFCITPNLLTAGMMRCWLLDEPFGPIDTFNQLEDA